MRINEISGMAPGRNILGKGSEILRKIAYDNDLGEPKAKPKKKKKQKPYQTAKSLLKNWWPTAIFVGPHYKKEFLTPDQLQWLNNNSEYKSKMNTLRKEFTRKRDEEGREIYAWRNDPRYTGKDKSVWSAASGGGVQTFQREAYVLAKKALERYTPPKQTPKSAPNKPSGKILKPDRNTRRPMHLELPS